MSSISRKREALIGVYKKSPKWRKKVLGMSESQVTAVYLRFQRDKKL